MIAIFGILLIIAIYVPYRVSENRGYSFETSCEA